MSLDFTLKRICPFAIYYFMFICMIGQRWLVLVSSEDMSAIPLSLYETKFLADSGIHTSSDAKIGDFYKRSGSSAFYGLRGKKQSDSLDINGADDKRGAFYPVRGKKKPTAFTALRGKKVYLGNEFSNEGNHERFQNDGNSSTLSQFLTNLKSNEDTWNSGKFHDDGPVSWEDAEQQRIYTPLRQEDHPWVNSKFPTETLEGKSADDVANDDNENSMDKRRTSGFFPMRGRKSDSDVTAQFYADKRRSAFIPMRGRKSYDDEGWLSDESTKFQKNAFSYGPTRNRRSIWNQNGFDHSGQMWSSNPRWPFSQGKRVAFHAVRGKKQSLRTDWGYPKRAFHASRGKRLEEEEEEDTENESNYDTSRYLDDGQRPNTDNNVSVSRVKRSIQRKMTRGKSRASIAMKRPITFFATRGKRFGENAKEPAFSFLLV